jgi:hypothetical protein
VNQIFVYQTPLLSKRRVSTHIGGGGLSFAKIRSIQWTLMIENLRDTHKHVQLIIILLDFLQQQKTQHVSYSTLFSYSHQINSCPY